MQGNEKKYKEHHVFSELQQYMMFYRRFSMSVFLFATMGTKAICNIDTYVYSSMQGTIESMRAILLTGRINDAYALLRKYYDSAVINIYSNLYLKNNFSIDNFVVDKINNWLQGKEKLPEYRLMSQYIRSSELLRPISNVFSVDARYKCLRDRCNDHTHYNFYHCAMLNDNGVRLKDRGIWLDQFAEDVRDIFIFHLGHIFFLNDHYLMSNDYLDALECGMTPEDDSQCWVAPFIQEVFDKIIGPKRPDVVAVIKASSTVHIS